MGGTNSETISGLRFHVNNGDVHIHDDVKKLKFVSDSTEFKTDLNSTFEDLKNTEGIVRIQGKSKTDFCVVKENKKFFCFLIDDTSIKSKLQSFLRGI